MIIYLAGSGTQHLQMSESIGKINKLDSFMYMTDTFAKFIPHYKRYILDSGAFTFIMQHRKGKKVSVSIDSFTDKYIDFVNAHNIEHFFEMDVDSTHGYDKVKSLRRRIESRTGRPTIPVFHKNRGLDDWKAMCKDYEFIALGIGGKDVSFTDWKTFKMFNDYAKSVGCRVHCLGVTGMSVLSKVDFYSVDSSSWTCGNRFKEIHFFRNGQIEKLTDKDAELKDMRIKDHAALAVHNMEEWIKFSRYAELNY